MQVLLSTLQPGQKGKFSLPVSDGVSLPVWAITGGKPGPTLVITAGVHGCEYIGIEAVRQLYVSIDATTQCGHLILLPLVNSQGFFQGAKQLVPTDGKNLNRVFPGSPGGTYSEQLALAIQRHIYPLADFLLDFHGGDSNEAMTPLVFFPTAVESEMTARSREAAAHLPVDFRVRSTAKNGLYSYAALCGIPSLLLEIGGGGLWSKADVSLGIECLHRLMAHLGILGVPQKNTDQLEGVAAVYESAALDGFWYPNVVPGQPVVAGTALGSLKDLDGNTLCSYTAQLDGFIWYHTTALGVQSGDPLLAYGHCVSI